MDCYACNMNCEPIKHNHHVTPRQFGGEDGDTVVLCPNCHAALHALASNKEGVWEWAKETYMPEAFDRLFELAGSAKSPVEPLSKRDLVYSMQRNGVFEIEVLREGRVMAADQFADLVCTT